MTIISFINSAKDHFQAFRVSASEKSLFSVFYLFFISSCSTLPPEIEEPPAIDISYLQAIDNISQYKGAPVRWGGVIIDVLNEQNYSLLQLMAYPLNSYGRPQKDKSHEGRFYVKSSTFLDPANARAKVNTMHTQPMPGTKLHSSERSNT